MNLLSWLQTLNIVLAIIEILIIPILLWVVKLLRSDMRKGLATKADLEAHVSRLAQVDRRITIVEKDLEYRPDQDDLSEIKKSLSKVWAEVQVLQSKAESIGAAVARIEDYLLNGPRK